MRAITEQQREELEQKICTEMDKGVAYHYRTIYEEWHITNVPKKIVEDLIAGKKVKRQVYGTFTFLDNEKELSLEDYITD